MKFKFENFRKFSKGSSNLANFRLSISFLAIIKATFFPFKFYLNETKTVSNFCFPKTFGKIEIKETEACFM